MPSRRTTIFLKHGDIKCPVGLVILFLSYTCINMLVKYSSILGETMTQNDLDKILIKLRVIKLKKALNTVRKIYNKKIVLKKAK